MKKTKKKKKSQKKHQTKRQLIFPVVILVALGIIIALYVLWHAAAPAKVERLVTFYDRGTKHVVLTYAGTVREALQAANINVDARDIVEPSQKSRLTESHPDVIIYRSRPVAVVDGGRHQTVMTVAQSPNAILKAGGFEPLGRKDKAAFRIGDIATDGAVVVLDVERTKLKKRKVVFIPRPDALTVSKGAQVFVDSDGVAHRETYYDLPMNIVIGSCGASGSYKVRSDGAKVDQDGYVLVAANLTSYPRCTIVETSLGPGKVYDTGGFAAVHPYGFDLATDWTNYNGQ